MFYAWIREDGEMAVTYSQEFAKWKMESNGYTLVAHADTIDGAWEACEQALEKQCLAQPPR